MEVSRAAAEAVTSGWRAVSVATLAVAGRLEGKGGRGTGAELSSTTLGYVCTVTATRCRGSHSTFIFGAIRVHGDAHPIAHAILPLANVCLARGLLEGAFAVPLAALPLTFVNFVGPRVNSLGAAARSSAAEKAVLRGTWVFAVPCICAPSGREAAPPYVWRFGVRHATSVRQGNCFSVGIGPVLKAPQ